MVQAMQLRPESDPAGAPSRQPKQRGWPSRAGAFVLKLPIHAYRYSLSMLMGQWCRHLPTCSQYALQAIDINGPWRGAWLTAARCLRCHPWGSSGFDPAPDITREHRRWTPWRYGRWRKPVLREQAPGVDHSPSP